MSHVTRLLITISLDDGDDIEQVIEGLPDHSCESFHMVSKNRWEGDFIVSCPVAPELAAGDFVDDLSPYFRELLEMKNINGAEYALQIAVGKPAPETFKLDSYSVALLAALGASIECLSSNKSS